VLIESERGRPIIVDRPLYGELVKAAIKRTHDDLRTKVEARAEAAAKEKMSSRTAAAPAGPVTVAKRERDAQLRRLADQAHGANADLGHALVHNLAAVDPTKLDVARFYCLCRSPHRTNYAERRLCRNARVAAAEDGLLGVRGRLEGRHSSSARLG
jgi:hypothetical protein